MERARERERESERDRVRERGRGRETERETEGGAVDEVGCEERIGARVPQHSQAMSSMD